jgi:hypothetical protein
VTCDGTGTALQDALNSLNPVANVYEVRVSGHCPESLAVSRFTQLTIRSADAANRATIGNVFFGGYNADVSARAPNGAVFLSDIVIGVTAATNAFAAIDIQQGNTVEISNVLVSCEEPSGCSNRVIDSYSSRVRAIGINATGIESPTMLFERGSTVLLSLTADVGTGACSSYSLMQVKRMSNLHLLVNGTCAVNQLYARSNSTITAILGNSPPPYINAGSSLVQGYNSTRSQWYSDVTCPGGAEVSDYPTGSANYCYEPYPMP